MARNRPILSALLLFFALWAGAWAGQGLLAQTPEPQIPGRSTPEIVGGTEAAPGAWPWMAALLFHVESNAYYAQYCGGALIAPQWVLTAAHCVESPNTDEPNEVDVLLGRHRLSGSGGERIPVTQIIRHPNYDSATMDSDLALLRLSRPSTYTPIPLVPAGDTTFTAPGTLATVIGWGDTRENGVGSYADALMQVSVPIVSNQTCSAAYPGDITDNMLCAGYPEGGKDSCQGDSGGPLMVPGSNGQGWLHAGIVSWGYDCAQPNYYGVYTRVSRFTPWIQSYLEGSAPTPTPMPTATPTPTPTPFPTATATPVPTWPVHSHVVVSNVRDSSFTVSWLSRDSEQDSVFLVSDYNQDGVDRFPALGTLAHWVTIPRLAPETLYPFTIFEANAPTYPAGTGPVLDTIPPSDTIYGQVKRPDGRPARDCVVLVTVVDADGQDNSGRSALLSTFTDGDGYWALNLGNARTRDLQAYFTYSPEGDQVEIQVQCSQMEWGWATVDTAQDAPTPDIVTNLAETQALTPLETGWNFFALPLEPTTPVSAASICQAGNFQPKDLHIPDSTSTLVEVDRWHNGGWESYICGVSSQDFTLEPDQGYFVRTQVPGVFLWVGSPTTSTMPALTVGWNSIGTTGWLKEKASALCGAEVLEVDRWHYGGWEGHLCGKPFNDFPLQPGKGYFVKAEAAEGGVRMPTLPQTYAPEPPGGQGAVTVPIQDLQITNLRDMALTLTWTTEEAAQSRVEVISSDGVILGAFGDDRGADTYTRIHHVTVTGLSPETGYLLRVVAWDKGQTIYYEGQQPVYTLGALSAIPRSQSAYGRVVDEAGVPLAGARVMVWLQAPNTDDSLPLSAVTDKEGYWVLNLGNARQANGEPYPLDLVPEVVLRVEYPGMAPTQVSLPLDATFPVETLTLGPARVFMPLVAR